MATTLSLVGVATFGRKPGSFVDMRKRKTEFCVDTTSVVDTPVANLARHHFLQAFHYPNLERVLIVHAYAD